LFISLVVDGGSLMYFYGASAVGFDVEGLFSSTFKLDRVGLRKGLLFK
jgi:hypothetical protein